MNTGEPIAGVTVGVGKFEHVLSIGEREEKWVRPYDTPGKDFTVKSDADGNFRISGVEPGARLLLLRDEVFAAVEGELLFELAPGERKDDIEIYVAEGGSLSGTVYNVGYDHGVEGVEVEAELASDRPWRRSYQCITADDGTFQIGGLPMGMCTIGSSMEDGFTQESLVFHGETPLYTMRDREALAIRWNTRYEPIEFTVKQGGLVRGRVVDANGAPVENAEVFLIANRSIRKDIHAYTRDDGSFQLRNWEYPHMPRLIAYKDGQYSRSPIPGTSDRSTDSVQLALLPSATLSGRFVDTTGAPLAGAQQPEVNIEIKGCDDEGSSTYRSAKPDSNGRFHLEDLPPITYDFIVWGGPFDLNAYNFAELSLSPGEVGVVEFVVDTEVAKAQMNEYHNPNVPPPVTMKLVSSNTLNANEGSRVLRDENKQDVEGGVVRGMVLNRENRAPVEDFDVTVYKWYGEHRVKLRDANTKRYSNGGFELSGLPFEKLVIEVRAEGYNLFEESILLDLETSAGKLTFQLDSFFGIRGELVDERGFPVSNAIVYYSDGTAQETPNANAMGSRRPTARKYVEADAKGVFFLECEPGKRVDLEVNSLYPPHREQVTAGPDAETRKRIVVTDGGALIGTVTKGGEPLANVAVGSVNSVTHTDSAGRYRLQGLRLGDSTLTCSFSESVSTVFNREKSIDFNMKQGETPEIDIEFLPGDASIAGRVTDSPEAPYPDVMVNMPFLHEETIDALIPVREDGTFLIPALPSGMVWLTCHEGRRRRVAVAATHANEISDVTISMKQGVTMSGSVARNGVTGLLSLYVIPGAADWRKLGSTFHHKLMFVSVGGARVEENEFTFTDVSTGTVSIICVAARSPDTTATAPTPILGCTTIDVGPDGLEGVVVPLGAPETGE